MRSIAAAIAVSLLASSAAADPYAPLDVSKLPEPCRKVAEIPRSTRSADPALSARISAASCEVDIALAGLRLSDDDASIAATNVASGPIIATLDEVIARGQAHWQMLALYVKGDLLFGLEARLRSTIPAITQATPLAAAQAIEHRHDVLEPKLARWDAGANAAFRQFTELAQANPQLVASNPVLGHMLERVAISAR